MIDEKEVAVEAPKKDTLIGLYKESVDLVKMIVEAGGEITPELEEQLQVNEEGLAAKVDGYVVIIDKFEHEADFFKARAEQLLAISKQLNNSAKRLKERIKYVMIDSQKHEFCGNDSRFKLAKGKDKLIIDEANVLPSYKVEKVTLVPDKERIKTELELGEDLEFARIEPSFTLRVYANKGGKK